MIESTLCYIERDDQYLMLHRTKKKNDVNEGKWVGIGGRLEPDETPRECILREAQEETGLALSDLRYRGIVNFLSDQWPNEKCIYLPQRSLRASSSYATKAIWPGLKNQSYWR